jgi:hypothetical protein
MPTISLPYKWKPRPYQQKLWSYLEGGGKRAVEIAHRRWGKDDVALHWAAVAAMQRPATYWHMLPPRPTSHLGGSQSAHWQAPHSRSLSKTDRRERERK